MEQFNKHDLFPQSFAISRACSSKPQSPRREHSRERFEKCNCLRCAGKGVAGSKNQTAYDQSKGETYYPRVLPVQLGDSLVIKNSDDVKHHSYSFSPPKTFSTPLQEKGQLKPLIMDKPGEVIIGCNIHDWMASFVLVVDTPFFAVQIKKGMLSWVICLMGSTKFMFIIPAQGTRGPRLTLRTSTTRGNPNWSLKFL